MAVKNNPLPTKNKDNYLSTIYIHCCHYLEKVLQSKDFFNYIRQVNVPYPNRTKSLKITKKIMNYGVASLFYAVNIVDFVS